MIQAVLFDLDGTLVQSEKLKANSYAQAVQQVRRLPDPDARAIEAYREIVGSSREVASRHIMERLGLEPDLRPLMADYGASEPVAVLTALRLQIYDTLVSDPQVLLENQWPHNVALLRTLRREGLATAVATMSTRKEARYVLETLGLMELLATLLGREDVQNPKPDPEIYLLAATRLNVPPEECLVIEDSPAGVQAGMSAGMDVVAVATPFTECGLRGAPGIDPQWIVTDPEDLLPTVRRRTEAHNRAAHPSKET